MPHRSKSELLEVVVSSLAGWEVTVLQATHPFEIATRSGRDRRLLHVYIWNVTHGGGSARSKDEYRIQITGVSGSITAPPDAQILLLGWHDDLGVFAAFDPVLHRRPSEASPSLQIPLATLMAASHGRIARHVRGNGEIALAFPPPRMGRYVMRQRYLHGSADEPAEAIDVLAGFTATDSAEVLAARDTVTRLVSPSPAETAEEEGQTHLFDAEVRRVIELHAMHLAIEHFERHGWVVEDVSAYAPYDLRCAMRGRVLHVEVKGTTSSGRSVLLTPNEVHHARTTTAETALYVVAEIELDTQATPVKASGGTIRLIHPWTIIDDALQPVGYEYTLPPES